jgi:hypothetical protein
MTKHTELKAVNQGTAPAAGTLALPPGRSRGLNSPFTGSNPFSPATQSSYFGASGDFREKSRHLVR